MPENYARWDASDYIKTGEDVRGLLRAATDEDPGDGSVIRAVLRYIARTQNVSALTRRTGISWSTINEALSEDGNPTLATLLRVTGALGLRLRLEAIDEPGGVLRQGSEAADVPS